MGDNVSNGIDVAKVAALARLKIEPSAVPELQKQMDAIVKYVEVLSELDVTGIEPTAHAIELVNVIRDDVAVTPFPREAMLSNAPETLDGELIKVPQVLPGEEMS